MSGGDGSGSSGSGAQRPWVRRVAVGLAVVLVAGLGLEYLAFRQAELSADRSQARREALVAARAVADTVGSVAAAVRDAEAGAGSEVAAATAVQTAVDRFAGRLQGVERIRVIDIATTRLLASSAPDDRAPRRLARDEKTLFDRAQLLRSNLRTNREERGARKELALVERRPAAGGDGEGAGLEVGVPLVRGDRVWGMLLVDTGPLVPGTPPAWWLPVLFAVGALLLLAAVARPLVGHKWPLNLTAAVLVVAALGGYALVGMEQLRGDRIAEEEAIAERVVATGQVARGAAAAVGVPGADLDPASWDADLFGRPRGTVGGGGEIDRAAVAREIGRSRGRLLRLVVGLTLAGLVLLLFFGLGYARRLAATVRQHRQPYLYVLPAIAGMLVLVFFPFFYGIALSFTESTLYNTDKSIFEIWVGLDNYLEILTDWRVFERTPDGVVWDYQNFYWTLGFTVVWTVSNVTFGVTVGLFLALVLNAKGLALKPFYRVLLILPWAVPNYITALIWRGMFHRQFGVINQIVQVLGAEPLAWFEQPFTSFLAVLATNGWLSFPFMMVVSLGALQSIPGDLYEAARVDGATGWQQFRSITLPSLKPALVPAIILSVIWTFNMFNIIYLTSQGEPARSTEILITEAYKIAFEQYRYGYAAAYSTVIFLILLTYGVWQNRITRATESIG